MPKQAPPLAFFFLHVTTGWPKGVVVVALASSLVRAGVSVQSVALIVSVVGLSSTLEFVWAPLVDASLTRKVWYAIGAAIMCACLVAMYLLPWNAGTVPLLMLTVFVACAGAGLAGVA